MFISSVGYMFCMHGRLNNKPTFNFFRRRKCHKSSIMSLLKLRHSVNLNINTPVQIKNLILKYLIYNANSTSFVRPGIQSKYLSYRTGGCSDIHNNMIPEYFIIVTARINSTQLIPFLRYYRYTK